MLNWLSEIYDNILSTIWSASPQNIFILVIVQLISGYVYKVSNESNPFKSDNELKLFIKKYSIYEDMYFNLVKNIEDDSDIVIKNNKDALNYLDRFCTFNLKEYNKKFRYLSQDLLECLYNYKKIIICGEDASEIIKKIKKYVKRDFDKVSRKMGFVSTNICFNFASKYWGLSFSMTIILCSLSFILMGTKTLSIAYLFWIIGNITGFFTIILCLITLYFSQKNKR